MNYLRQIGYLVQGWWVQFLATFRLSNSAICEMSSPLGMVDYHDYTDTDDGMPYHFIVHRCKRCGKEFSI